MDWERDYITWYLNGKQVAQQPTPASMNSPMTMLIDRQPAVGFWQGASRRGDRSDAGRLGFTSIPVTHTPASPVDAAHSASPLARGPTRWCSSMSEDAYNGDAQFTVSVDGKQLGGTFTTTASHATGASQSFTFKGDWAVGTHAVAVNFLNDAYGGTRQPPTATSMSNSISYDGANTGQNAALWRAGPAELQRDRQHGSPAPRPPPVTTGSGSDTLVLSISEDAYQGDAQFTVSVDGKQLAGTFTHDGARTQPAPARASPSRVTGRPARIPSR